LHSVYSASEIQHAVETLRPLGLKPVWLAHEALRGIGEKVPTGRLSDEEDERLGSNLRNWQKSIYDQFSKASNVLYTDLKDVNPEDFDDPDDVVIDSISAAESQYISTREELKSMHETIFVEDVNSLHDSRTCEVLIDLIELYRVIIGCLQELRWSLCILDSVHDPVVGPLITSGAEFIEALDEPDPK